MQKIILVTRGILVLPYCKKTIIVARSKSVKALLFSLKTNKQIVITSQNDPNIEEYSTNDVYHVGSLCEIISCNKSDQTETGDNDTYTVVIEGKQRVNISNLKFDKNGYYTCDISQIKEQTVALDKLKTEFELLLSLFQKKNKENLSNIVNSPSFRKQSMISKTVDKIADTLPLSIVQIKDFLSEPNLINRIKFLHTQLVDRTDQLKIENEINSKINQELTKQQKEFYLKQKISVIKDELGKISPSENDPKSLRNKVESNPYPADIKKRAFEEITHIETNMNPQENAIIRTYLDWLLNIPYWTKTNDNKDISSVEKTLNASHFGLEKVKERIIEYLAVKNRNPNSKSPILCLVGPPGVGKSTLARSIANALGKKFVKMALGGVHDESEIRGHRKTYLGSMPGRIIKCMKKAEVINPLFLLDEIDKMTSDNVHGDPTSALLEVLDPEQNSSFVDNYLEEAYDLSQVMFVATANYPEQIPEPLYDRLEIIELTSYTEHEKLEIAKKYSIPKILKETNLTKLELKFNDDAIMFIINHYTKEAGVRELERLINKIARKFIVKQLHKKIKNQIIDINAVKEYLDKEIYDFNVKDEKNLPGVVNGMAYTLAGGDLLPIEVTYFKGKGNISITGNLKETMRESATVALGYVKANANKFKLDKFSFKDFDIHIHVPSGGIPKDGPSAGVTLTTAIISSLTNTPVSSNIAMTGEITLRGKVLIIGGVKEKVISAFRSGINEIFIPKDDERYLKDVPVEVRKKIKFHFVKEYSDIYNAIFG